MPLHSRTMIGGLLLLAFARTTSAQPPDISLPDPKQGYQWKEVAQKQGLSEQDIEQLAKHKILITNEAFKQIFTPYIESDLPIFITSDSILNGFHVLLEESVLRLEQANARKLPGILRFIWQNLKTVDKDLEGKPELVAAAKTRAQVVIGTALRLLGDDAIQADLKTAGLIDVEVRRITAARDRTKPEWLGPPDRGFVALDYSRYKPRGFYTRSEQLQRYFRAVSWLQSIPFRVNNDEELLCIVMLGNCINRGGPKGAVPPEGLSVFFHSYDSLIGNEEGWDLMTASQVAPNELSLDLDQADLANIRERLLEWASSDGERPEISDQLAFPPLDPTQVAEVGFRVIAPYRTPDAVLFQRTTDLRKFRRPFPKGLEICAVLGCTHARSRLSRLKRQDLLTTIEECETLFHYPTAEEAFFSPPTLYAEYLHCLQSLLDKPEPDGPPFMWSEAWKIKSCQTALAGWAQLRHTWSLQAKQSVRAFGGPLLPPGFVEPEPEFFARMARLVEHTQRLFTEAGAFEVDLKAAVAAIRELVTTLESDAGHDLGNLDDLTTDDLLLLGTAYDVLAAVDLLPLQKEGDDRRSQLVSQLNKLASMLQGAETVEDPTVARAIEQLTPDSASLWTTLGTLCRRLECLAHKQLRGVPFGEEENSFLNGYGAAIAEVIFYYGESYSLPRDDAPRVVDVFHNPLVAGPQYLEAAIARPRALYVLYPVEGGEILCRGAVMPYYEFRSDRRLNDTEWKTLLDSADRPEIPSWVKPIMGSDAIKIPGLD